MQSNNQYNFRRAMIIATVLIALGLQAPAADAKQLWKKQWVITITAPDSLSGNRFGIRTFTIKARNFDSPPSPLPLRKLTATGGDGTEVQGVWRQFGRDFSLTFELPCNTGEVCATVILRGSFQGKKAMSGEAILMWDTADRDNVARFETVNGTFEGARL